MGETTPLLRGGAGQRQDGFEGVGKSGRILDPPRHAYSNLRDGATAFWYGAKHPELWDVNAVVSASLGAVSAVLLGLLLNVLDALSYGK